MTKSDLKLIYFFIDKGNPRVELNYAYLGADGIYATDTRKLIKYHVNELNLNLRLHKKIFNGFISHMTNDSEASIDGFGNLLCDGVKLNCDTFNTSAPEDYKYVDFNKILSSSFDYKIVLDNIDDLQFELSQRDCFIDDDKLNSIIDFSVATSYDILYNKQSEEDGHTNTGMCKIIAYGKSDESEFIKYEAVVMGREFKTKTEEQLLLDL